MDNSVGNTLSYKKNALGYCFNVNSFVISYIFSTYFPFSWFFLTTLFSELNIVIPISSLISLSTVSKKVSYGSTNPPGNTQQFG